MGSESAERAINSEAIKVRRIIVLVKSNVVGKKYQE